MKSVNIKTPDALGGEGYENISIEGPGAPNTQLLNTLIEFYSIKSSAPVADLVEVAAIGSCTYQSIVEATLATQSWLPGLIISALLMSSWLLLCYLWLSRKQYRPQLIIKSVFFVAGVCLAWRL